MKGIRSKVTIEKAYELALRREGKCLDRYYVAKEKLFWQCKKMHKWKASYNSVRRGSWCGVCAGVKKLSIEVAHEIAKSKEGKCLSKTYKNGRAALLWECKVGHRWKQGLNAIRNGKSWCGKCNVPGFRQTIKEMKELAESRGGKCLSLVYRTAKNHLIWQCKLKHNSWKATPDIIKRGSWCPECADGLGERICRLYFEAIFNNLFPTVRPDFLKNPLSGVNLELDGYCESLHIGFEHHGRQHFETTSYFSHEIEQLLNRKKTDLLKRTLCKNANVKLIEIPSVPDMLSLYKLPEFLLKEFSKASIQIPYDFDFNKVDLSAAFSPDSKIKLNEMKKIAIERGGKCLSDGYLGLHGKLKWRCKLNHEIWEVSPAKILYGRWCPECGGRKKKTLKIAQDLAKTFGATCLSSVYVNGKKKLFWKCKFGHRWDASFDSVNRGSRCPDCYYKKRKEQSFSYSIKDMKILAENNGGKCLSKKYLGSSEKLNWKCKLGHIWSAIPDSIKRGSWCPICSRVKAHDKLRSGIEKLRKWAKNLNGECLSSNYKNNQSKILWRCHKKHEWSATAGSVFSGTWCPMCAIEIRADKRRTNMSDIQALAISKGGICLSHNYKPSEKLQWQCQIGHEWNAMLSSIRSGSWCLICAKKNFGAYKRLSLSLLQQAASKRGGKCLSSIYQGSQEKYLWQCKKGHTWEAIATTIISRNYWCPICAGRMRKTIQDMCELAALYRGKCLSPVYTNARTKLKWQCSEGHIWTTTPSSIQQGSWCQSCKKLTKAFKKDY